MHCDSRFTPNIKPTYRRLFLLFTDKFRSFTAKTYYFLNKYNKYDVSIKCRRIFVSELKTTKK